MITQESLKELLHYNPETGIFTWRVRTSNRIRVGGVAGWEVADGYLCVSICGKSYYAHRLAWLYMTGVWPNDELDHVNGVRDDNRIINLHEATHAHNGQNRARQANTSGFMGVCWDKQCQKWKAQIVLGGKNKYLGLFGDPEAAHAAYCAAKAQLHTFQPVLRE